MTSPTSSESAVVIIGATSAIACAVARLLAARGASFMLVARHRDRLQAVAADLQVRGARRVVSYELDVDDIGRYAQLVAAVRSTFARIDLLLVAHGSLPDQHACEQSIEAALNAIRTNGTSVVLLVTALTPLFEVQAAGTIAVLSSVAGDRGRRSNYVYGSAKAMVDTFLSGHRNRLSGTRVRVLTIKPGLVKTPMTSHFVKTALWAEPETVARDVVRAIDTGRDVLYTPCYWRPIMAAIRLLPEPIFKRLKL